MNEASPTGTALIDTVADWLMDQALMGAPSVEQIVDGCCARLSAAGIPLWRSYVAFRTLHPLLSVVAVDWTRDGGVETTGYRHDDVEMNLDWQNSPLNRIMTSRVPMLRRRLSGPEAMRDFPILDELRDGGATDYLAFVVPFNAEWDDGVIGSWATDRASGFSDGDIRALLRIQQRLAVACKVKIEDEISRNIVDAYLGPNAGQRGDYESIHAAIWYSDLRDSTGLAEALPPDRYLMLLNDYFECTAGAVTAEGGEVLLLLGDAVLAIFPIGKAADASQAACAAALRTVAESARRLAAANRDRGDEPHLACGIGLHCGDLMFGNIGVPERLQFTVVGPAANEVARIHDLAKQLARPVLVSDVFARQLPLEWQPLGRHELRGIASAREVFAPPTDSQRAAE